MIYAENIKLSENLEGGTSPGAYKVPSPPLSLHWGELNDA